ncbi:hypothetical protein AVEN_30295-1 [Araneus ventricosus]|uniref:Uncharacterized protein n=1 Tax=Araneus ventricosus TaxID=182803 RepID=A0A4Y2T329_ARAVE|nr:hypothetical protein AVEN_30295-1 [Araneus ventricosus]
MTRMTPEPALPSSSFPTTPAGGGLVVTDLTSTRPAYTAVIRWNQVSNLEPSSFEVETLPPGHRGPQMHRSTRKSSLVHQYQTCCGSTVNGQSIIDSRLEWIHGASYKIFVCRTNSNCLPPFC